MTTVRRLAIAVIITAGLAALTTTIRGQQGGGSEALTSCTWTFTKGTGSAQISYCVNAHGNVMSFIAPAGVEHIRVGPLVGAGYTDGYAVCSGTPYTEEEVLHGYDFGDYGESTWGPAEVVAGPTAGGVTVRRTTADGRHRIQHAFSLDGAEGDVTVTATIVNLTGSSLTHVDYTRLSDFDAAGYTDNLWTRTDDDVSAISRAAHHGISLNAISFNTSHWVAIGVFNSVDTHHCDGFYANGSDADGDYYARLVYHLGTLSAGQSKSVKFVYRRQ